MKSLLWSTLVIAVFTGVIMMPSFRLRAQGNSDLGGLKQFEVECQDPTIGGPTYNCKGDMIGNGALTDAVAFGNSLGLDGAGSCALDSGTDTIQTPDGSTLTLKSHGMICFETTAGFAVRHNAYLIEGGTGRFAGATGTGNIVVSSENPIGLPMIHIDGNIHLAKGD